MVFPWIRDIKLMTKLYYFCHLTVWTRNLQKIQREVPCLAPGKCHGVQKSDIIYDYGNQSRYDPAESTRLGRRGCHVSMRAPGSSGQVSIAKLISNALNSYLCPKGFKVLFHKTTYYQYLQTSQSRENRVMKFIYPSFSKALLF